MTNNKAWREKNREHVRAWNQEYRKQFKAVVRRQHTVTHTVPQTHATVSDRMDCSLSGWDPPWQWTWNRTHAFTPFSEMKIIPTGALYGGHNWSDTEWMAYVLRRLKRGDV